MQKKVAPYFKYIVLAALLYMPIFGHLDTMPLRIWDEARVAMNAYEMNKNGNYIVTYFEGYPDMWNTKPPLMVWSQVLFMKVLGTNELAVRLPSALAAFFTCVLLLLFAQRYLKSFWFGFIAVLVLVTSLGYVNMHATRSGDYDAMLTLFTTASGLLFFAFIETKKYKYLYLFFIATALAVLTKSVVGLLFLPALVIYAIIQKQALVLLKSKHFYFGLLAFLGLVLGYYALREMYNPGYLKAVQENEFGGRFLEVIEEHKASFWFYYNNFLDTHFSWWYLFVPCGLVTGLVIKNKKLNRITLFSFLMVGTFFLIISSAQTKLAWYDVPMYPFLAIIIAVFLHWVFTLIQNLNWLKSSLAISIAPFLFLLLVLGKPYQKVFNKTYTPREEAWEQDFYEIGYYLKDAIRGKYNLNNQFLLYDGYYAHNLFYLNVLNDKGFAIKLKDWKDLAEGDVVIVPQKHIRQFVEDHYDWQIIGQEGNVVTYKIYGGKK